MNRSVAYVQVIDCNDACCTNQIIYTPKSIHSLIHIPLTRSESLTKLFQASQHELTMSSYPSKHLLANSFCLSHCQICSTGFHSGEYAGSLTSVMLSKANAVSSVCQPAPSIITTACRSVGVACDICCRCCLMASLFT